MTNPAGCLLVLASIVAAIPASPISATEPQRLFDCKVGHSITDSISLYAVQQNDGTWTDLHFLVKVNGIINASVSERRNGAQPIFYFSNSDGPEGYLAKVRFNDAGRSYVLAMLDIPPDPNEENDMGGRSAALTITEPGGVSYHFYCGEIEEHIGLMQEAMACDTTNPYGLAGCNFDRRPVRSASDQIPLSLQ